MYYKVHARLTIGDFECSPEEITQIMGLPPDRVRTKGEIVRETIKAKRSYWRIDSPADPTDSSISDQWIALRQRLDQPKERLRNLPQPANVILLVVVEGYEFMPDVVVPARVMTELAELGAGVRIAIYDFIEEDKQETEN